MYPEDVRDELLRLSAELRDRSHQARAESARLVAKSKELVTEMACLRHAAPDSGRQERSRPQDTDPQPRPQRRTPKTQALPVPLLSHPDQARRSIGSAPRRATASAACVYISIVRLIQFCRRKQASER